MEKELGAPLFERNGRSVLLTPYGEVFYEHVCLALRAIDDGVAAVSARSSASFGTVNLGTTFTTQDHYLPSLIRDFEEAFDKRVIVKVSQGFTNYLTEQLQPRLQALGIECQVLANPLPDAPPLAFGSNAGITFLLVFSGVITAIPLVLFSYAARRVEMTTIAAQGDR